MPGALPAGLPLFLQPKLAISQPGDPYEQEADRVADQVMRMSVPTVQRQCAACEEEEAVMVSRKAEGTVAGEAPRSVHSTLRSAGQPLSASARAFFEPRFGQDLSHVRVHTDQEAQQSARAVNALAYTVGSHVVFGAERYAPATTDGQRLLAHELAHVVQQSHAGLALQRQDAGGTASEPFLVKLPPDGIHLKVLPSLSADNFPGDRAMNEDIVTIKNTGGAATYRKVKDGTWSWIEIPGKRSPDRNYPMLHGFIETRYIANMTIGPLEQQQKKTGPYNDCNDSPLDQKYSIVGEGDSSEKYQHEIDRLEQAKKICPDWGSSIDGRLKALRTFKLERGNSMLADCGLALKFDGVELDCGTGGTFLAVSGEERTDAQGKYFDYSPDAQRKPGGPIPEGVYWLNPEELKNLSWRRLKDKTSWPEIGWGSHAITIHPFETTPTFGRGGFFIHGGAVPGSIGCIDVTNNMDKVAGAIDGTEDCKIKLTVQYRSVRIPA
jgi:Domain of unknown function (DUF4157)